MIEYLSGSVAELTPTTAVIECNGVGYLAQITLNTYAAIQRQPKVKLYIYEAIREDAVNLYGFLHKAERETFLLLISVSGVGANTARMILSAFSPADLHQAIVSANVGMLKSVKGIGAKTAERIIVDLKDKIKQGDTTLNVLLPSNNEVAEEAVAALVMLGFSQQPSQKAVAALIKENPSAQVEHLIKGALKLL